MALAFRQVTRDFRVADEVVIVVVNCADYHRGPKARSVFANPPSFPLKMAVCFGCCQYLIGEICRYVLRHEEATEMPPQDFRARVPLVPLCSTVPSGYPSLKVQHIN